jgi:hypothetical protein
LRCKVFLLEFGEGLIVRGCDLPSGLLARLNARRMSG